MNPQRARHLRVPDPGPISQPDGFAGDDGNAPIGSKQSGYAGPELGPFECENCTHFEEPNRCNHPQVQSDPEVNGQVDPEGCCTYFANAGKETQEQEHGENQQEEQQP